ncbi:MAG: Tim44/TimA family putative adaptor protein [Hyphomicrobiaceae bacterium]
MEMNSNLFALLSLVVAVIVILKLRSVLGRRTGDERARYEQRVRAQQEAQERALAQQDKVVALPRREHEGVPQSGDRRAARADAEARIRTYAGGDAALERGLVDIFRADGVFDPAHFMQGAKAAYEMIVTAFAEGNRKGLKDLLSREVFDGFAAAIADREHRGEQIDQSFVGINKADLVEAVLKNDMAQVTVKFVSHLISATRDRHGEVIAGDPQKIKEVTDIWTFARDVAARDPNWRLVATQTSN